MHQRIDRRKLLNCHLHVNGQASKESDVDILVDSPLRGLEFYALLEDVINTLHKDVDLIEARQLIEKSSMKDDINHNGIEIYTT